MYDEVGDDADLDSTCDPELNMSAAIIPIPKAPDVVPPAVPKTQPKFSDTLEPASELGEQGLQAGLGGDETASTTTRLTWASLATSSSYSNSSASASPRQSPTEFVANAGAVHDAPKTIAVMVSSYVRR